MDLQIELNSLATRLFRNTADLDYVASRACYRLGMRDQFLWLAMQAIEKYLKAILLYNGRSARWEDPNAGGKEYGHDVGRLLAAAKGIGGLGVLVSERAKAFVTALARIGPNRYLTKTVVFRGEELSYADESVWHVRRYAQVFGWSIGSTAHSAERQARELAWIHDPKQVDHPHVFHPFHGTLERLLAQPRSDLSRQALVWQNLWYGSKSRTSVRYKSITSGALYLEKLRRNPSLLRKVERFIRL